MPISGSSFNAVARTTRKRLLTRRRQGGHLFARFAGGDLFLAGGFPEHHLPLLIARGQPPAVGGERHARIAREAAEREDLPPGRRIPELDGAVFVPGRQPAAVRREGQRVQDDGVQEGAEKLSGRGVPERGRRILARRRQRPSSGRKRNGDDVARLPRERPRFTTGREIPEPDRAPAYRRQQLPIGGEREGVVPLDVPLERRRSMTRRHPPEPD